MTPCSVSWCASFNQVFLQTIRHPNDVSILNQEVVTDSNCYRQNLNLRGKASHMFSRFKTITYNGDRRRLTTETRWWQPKPEVVRVQSPVWTAAKLEVPVQCTVPSSIIIFRGSWFYCFQRDACLCSCMMAWYDGGSCARWKKVVLHRQEISSVSFSVDTSMRNVTVTTSPRSTYFSPTIFTTTIQLTLPREHWVPCWQSTVTDEISWKCRCVPPTDRWYGINLRSYFRKRHLTQADGHTYEKVALQTAATIFVPLAFCHQSIN